MCQTVFTLFANRLAGLFNNSAQKKHFLSGSKGKQTNIPKKTLLLQRPQNRQIQSCVFFWVTQIQSCEREGKGTQRLQSPIWEPTLLSLSPETPLSLASPDPTRPTPTHGRAARTSPAPANPESPRSRRPVSPARSSPGDGGQWWGRGWACAPHLQELQAAVRPGGEPPLRLPLPHRPLRRWDRPRRSVQ
jgi:hypothetical protein